MVVCYPQFMEPWQSSRVEDRRFRRILLAVLMLFGMLSYIVPNWELPQLPALLEEPRLPPRLARVITERMTPAPPPAATARSAAPDPANHANPFISNPLSLYMKGRIRPAMAINGRRNKPFGPGGGTRRLHHEFTGPACTIRRMAGVGKWVDLW